MKKLSLTDKMRACEMSGETLPLKGDIRLVLEDVRDGTQQVEEVHNIATAAIQSIISHNYSGIANISALFPLRNLMGGVLLFQNAQTEQASNFNPPSDLQNPLIAHAGNEAPAQGYTGTLRGTPVVNDYEITDTSIKQVWMWDNTQGNGHIESVSLCPAVLGNMGLKPADATYSPVSQFGSMLNNNDSFSEEISKKYPFNISDDGKTSWSVWLSGTTFKEYTMRHDYNAFGIMRGATDWQDVADRSATVRSGDNRFIFDDADFYYIARATSATTLQVDKVSKTTFAVTQADCTFSGVSLWTGNFNGGKNVCMRMFAFDGTYLYYPNSAGNQFVKLNLADNSDVLVLDGTLTIDKGQRTAQINNGEQFVSPLVINSGLVLGSDYIINGNATYPIKCTRQVGCDNSYYGYQNWLWLVRQGAACYGHGKQTYSTSYRSGQVNALVALFLSSVANLQTARDKSTSMTMRVEYTTSENV